jgi:uncharacterized MAPEG superfamily protein
MTVPLWCLIGFVVWTIVLVAALSWARLRHLARGGSHRDFGIPDDRKLIWRLFRAHLNALENLPLFASVILVATYRGIASLALDALSVVYLAARIGQSLVHIAPGAGIAWNQRFILLIVQLVCLLGLIALAVGVF